MDLGPPTPSPRQRGGIGKTQFVDDSALNPRAGDDDELVTANEPRAPRQRRSRAVAGGKIPIPGVQQLQSEFNWV